MHPYLLAIIACLIAGIAQAVQSPTNAMLARPLGGPVNAALASFAIGTLILALAALVVRAKPDLALAAKLPVYAWLGGAYGAYFVVTAVFATPRLGVASVVTLMIAGQLAASLAIDHVGAFGVLKRAASPERLLGLGLVLAGVYLVRRS